MKRGDVIWAQLVPRSGSEQQGTRPGVVVSHDTMNQSQNWHSIIVVPVTTSTAQLRRRGTIVFIPAGSSGLSQDSFAICHQVTTLDRSKFGQAIGSLAPHLLSQIDAALKIAMNLS